MNKKNVRTTDYADVGDECCFFNSRHIALYTASLQIRQCSFYVAFIINICYICIFKFRYSIYFMQCTRYRSHSNYLHKKSDEKLIVIFLKKVVKDIYVDLATIIQ